ncbi:MAG: transposase [Oligoflexus sp.]
MSRLYHIKDYNRANRVFKLLLDTMGRSQQKAVLAIRAMLISWSSEITNYFKTGLTNARTEGAT